MIWKEPPMTIARVWILFEPQIYCDLFTNLLQRTGWIEVVNSRGPAGNHHEAGNGEPELVDVIVFSLDARGQPHLAGLAEPPPGAKLLAFSPKGDLGYRRLPGEETWEEVRPFGLDQLIREVQFGRGRPADSAELLDEWLASNHRLKSQLRRKAQSNQYVKQQDL